MRMPRMARLAWSLLALLLALSVISGFAASNTVAESGAGESTFPITANDLKPPECAPLNLVNILVGSGRFDGTNRNDLILGSAADDNIRGMGGDDCILGGGGNDQLDGRQGNDILLGGPGDDHLVGFTGYDICYGGTGTDTTDGSCEETYEIP